MRRSLIGLIISAGCLVLGSAVARADASLGFPTIGVRGEAMGNAFVAVANDINSIGWNPAGLMAIDDRQIQVAHSDLYGFGIDYNYVAYAQHQYGVGWAHIDAGDFILGGGSYTQDMYIVSGAQQMDPQTTIGASLKWHTQKFSPGEESVGTGESSAATSDGYSIDAGVLYKADESTTLGVTVYDLLGELKTKNSTSGLGDNLKPNICVGVSRLSNDKTSILAIQLSKLGEETTVHFGVEKKVQDELFLRAGMDNETITAGLGFRRDQWDLDYSYKNKPSTGLDKTQRFSATMHF